MTPFAFPLSQRERLRLERSVDFTKEGHVRLRQRFTGDDLRVVVTHDASLLARVHVVSGAIYFPTGSGERRAPARFVFWVPPRSVVPMRFAHADVLSVGIGRVGAFGSGPAGVLGDPGGVELSPALATGVYCFGLNPDHGVPLPIARARSLLHEHLHDLAPVRRVAREVGMLPDTLTRAFARTWHLTPKQYCHRARLFDAVIRLLGGAPILATALLTGFNDSSRFYAQFRRLVGATPGAYAAAGNRQDRGRSSP